MHHPTEMITHTTAFVILFSGVGRCQKVCVCVGGGGGGGLHRHVIYVPSIKNQYKRVVFGYMVI